MLLDKFDLQLFSDEGEEIIPEGEETNINEGEETLIDEPVDGEEPEGGEGPPEEVIPKSHVSKIVSERVNQLNEKYKDYGRYKGTIERLANMAGLTEDQFFTQLEQVELQQQAQQMGVSPEIAKRMSESQRALEDAKRVTLDMKYQMEEQTLMTNPLYEDYNNVKDQVRQVAEASNMTLEQAYWAINGPALLEKQTKLAEHRVSHNMQHKQKRGTVEGEGGGKVSKNAGAALDDRQRRMAEAMGLSADEYALYNDEDLDYDKILEMKTKKQGGK